VGVVDQGESWTLLRHGRQQAEGGGADGKAVPDSRRTDGEGAGKGPSLRFGEGGDSSGNRPKQVGKSRIREFRFGFQPTGGQDCEAGSLFSSV
jgi:hypothetical protein